MQTPKLKECYLHSLCKHQNKKIRRNGHLVGWKPLVF